MLSAAQYGLPFKKQRVVTTDTVLTVNDLGILLAVESSGGPVTITLPAADTVRGGGNFYILALRGGVNPVTVTVAAGDSYNAGLAAPVILNQDGQILDCFGTESASAWLLGFHSASPNSATNILYDDTLVTPLLGATTVQTAIDALKPPIATVGLAGDQTLPGGALAPWDIAASLAALDPTAYALGTDSFGVMYVAVLRAGQYIVHISALADHGPGSSRSQASHTLFLDALATEVFVPVAFSEMGTYHRLAAAGRDGDATAVALTLPAGARLTGGSIRTAGAAAIILQSEGCNITLHKVSS